MEEKNIINWGSFEKEIEALFTYVSELKKKTQMSVSDPLFRGQSEAALITPQQQIEETLLPELMKEMEATSKQLLGYTSSIKFLSGFLDDLKAKITYVEDLLKTDPIFKHIPQRIESLYTGISGIGRVISSLDDVLQSLKPFDSLVKTWNDLVKEFERNYSGTIPGDSQKLKNLIAQYRQLQETTPEYRKWAVQVIALAEVKTDQLQLQIEPTQEELENIKKLAKEVSRDVDE